MSTAEDQRERDIVRTSIIGIVANIALAAFKAAVGALSHSIAITLDAVNNLSDAASSAITIVGTKLAGRAPDHDHPFGYGRLEYLTTMVIGLIVLAAGAGSLSEAVRSILSPETPDYALPTLIIVAVAVAAKLALGAYFQRRGAALRSDSLVASGKDASFDAVISASTLVAAVLYLTAGVSIEAWLGAVISLVIIKAGIDIEREAIGQVLGERTGDELARDVYACIRQVPGVLGAYDLVLNDYGPDRLSGSVHVEVAGTATAREIDALTRQIQAQVIERCGVLVHTVGIYAVATEPGTLGLAIREALADMVAREEAAREFHGLFVDEERKSVVFDLVVGFEAPDRGAVRDRVVAELAERWPDLAFSCNLDTDIAG